MLHNQMQDDSLTEGMTASRRHCSMSASDRHTDTLLYPLMAFMPLVRRDCLLPLDCTIWNKDLFHKHHAHQAEGSCLSVHAEDDIVTYAYHQRSLFVEQHRQSSALHKGQLALCNISKACVQPAYLLLRVAAIVHQQAVQTLGHTILTHKAGGPGQSRIIAKL